MRLQLQFLGKLDRSSTMISGKEYNRRISNPLARQNKAAVPLLKAKVISYIRILIMRHHLKDHEHIFHLVPIVVAYVFLSDTSISL